MENLMTKFFKSSIIISGVLIILGLLLIFESEATIISISYIIGGALSLLGVLAIIKFIKNINNSVKNELDIVYGIVTIILGILIIQNPHAIASIIPFVLGVGIIISSATKLQYAIELKHNENNLWKATMIISIVSAVCGIILLFNPFKGAVIFTKIVGAFITIYAVLDIISTVAIKKNVKDIHEALEGTIADAEIVEEVELVEKDNKKVSKSKKKNKTSKKNNKESKEWFNRSFNLKKNKKKVIIHMEEV